MQSPKPRIEAIETSEVKEAARDSQVKEAVRDSVVKETLAKVPVVSNKTDIMQNRNCNRYRRKSKVQ